MSQYNFSYTFSILIFFSDFELESCKEGCDYFFFSLLATAIAGIVGATGAATAAAAAAGGAAAIAGVATGAVIASAG